MTHELSHDELTRICCVLETAATLEQAVLFGSRAVGQARRGSDVDIMLYGQELQGRDVAEIAGLLDETTLPYQFDLLRRQDVTNEALLEQVEKFGKVIFRR